MTKSGKLKRCPFCGSAAIHVFNEIDRVWMVGCTNRKCIVSVDVVYQGFDYWSANQRRSERIWNTRAQDGGEAYGKTDHV